MSAFRILAAVAVFVMAVVAWVPVASASLQGQIFLDPAPPDLITGCTTPCPVANIDITLAGQDANFIITALTNAASGFTFLLGGVGGAGGPGGGIFGLDIFPATKVAPNVSVTNISATFGLGGPAALAGVVSGLDNVDGTGSYNVFVAFADGKSHGSTDLLSSLSFTVHNATTAWGCIKEFSGGIPTPGCVNPLIENDLNGNQWTNMLNGLQVQSISWAEAHVSRCFTASLATGSCGSTGVVTAFAGGATIGGEVVPEPGTLVLLGSGVILVGGALARRFRK